jgi:hypothetical protein
MLMLIDTPDPRYGGDPGGDGPGPPHVGVRTVAPSPKQWAAVLMRRWPDGLRTTNPELQVPPPLWIEAPPQKGAMSSRR